MASTITIGSRRIGAGEKVYIVAELSANHHQDYDQAVRIIHAAKEAGADAIKLQTYTPDTITIESDLEYFRIGGGTLWDGQNLHELYSEAYTPWEWQPKLKKVADDLEIDLFSSPFDLTAVEFLEKMKVPAYKVASCELVDIPLIQRIAKTGKPIIISTGMGSSDEIHEAVTAARNAGASQIALLKCTAAYPAPVDEMNLRTIPELQSRFSVPVGLSDHTKGIAVAVAAVALGACILEKHFTISRTQAGPDSQFSLEPHEFSEMVNAVRNAERALGNVHFGPTAAESSSLVFRRSLFVVQNVKAGETYTNENVKSIRPGHGLHTRYLPEVVGKRAACDVNRGTPLSWSLLDI